jgi:hypothetical protein
VTTECEFGNLYRSSASKSSVRLISLIVLRRSWSNQNRTNPLSRNGILARCRFFQDQRAYVETPAVQNAFFPISSHGNGAVICPAFFARLMTAGLDEVREASSFIRGSCCDARRGFWPDLLRGVVPLAHRLSCTLTCRPPPVSSCGRFCSSPRVGLL